MWTRNYCQHPRQLSGPRMTPPRVHVGGAGLVHYIRPDLRYKIHVNNQNFTLNFIIRYYQTLIGGVFKIITNSICCVYYVKVKMKVQKRPKAIQIQQLSEDCVFH